MIDGTSFAIGLAVGLISMVAAEYGNFRCLRKVRKDLDEMQKLHDQTESNWRELRERYTKMIEIEKKVKK